MCLRSLINKFKSMRGKATIKIEASYDDKVNVLSLLREVVKPYNNENKVEVTQVLNGIPWEKIKVLLTVGNDENPYALVYNFVHDKDVQKAITPILRKIYNEFSEKMKDNTGIDVSFDEKAGAIVVEKHEIK